MSFISKGSSSESPIVFSYYVSLDSSKKIWKSSSVSFWLSWPWHFWGWQASCLVACPSLWGIWCCLMVRFRLCTLAAKSQKYYVFILPMHPIRQHGIVVCPIPDDVDFDHLIEELSAQFFHHKVTLFPFVISKYFVGSYFKTMWISCSSSGFSMYLVF